MWRTIIANHSGVFGTLAPVSPNRVEVGFVRQGYVFLTKMWVMTSQDGSQPFEIVQSRMAGTLSER